MSIKTYYRKILALDAINKLEYKLVRLAVASTVITKTN